MTRSKKSTDHIEEVEAILWDQLKNKLENYDYWKTTPAAQWDLTAYDMALLRASYNSKRMARAKLLSDLAVIEQTFSKQHDVKRSIKIMRDSTGKGSSRDAQNQSFWETTAMQLNEASQKLEVAAANLKASTVNAAAETLDCLNYHDLFHDHRSRRSPSPEAEEEAENDDQHVNKKQKATPEEPQASCSLESATSKIKSKAEKIAEKHRRSIDIPAQERKLMTNGLSSILDLSDNSSYSQKLLFSAQEWTSMSESYQKKYAIESIQFPSQLASIWAITCHKMQTSRSIESGMKYLYQVYPKYFDNKDIYFPLKALEVVLDALAYNPYLMAKQADIDVTEYDYLGNVWLPLFRYLFRGSSIRIKTHESTFKYTTEKKSDQFPDAKNVVGFKIDVRFLVDYEGKEYDLCSGEMAKHDDLDKETIDRAKLNRESKDDLDCMLELCSDDEWVNCTAWQFQSTGSIGNICSIHLAANGLYVVLQRYKLSLPSSIAELPGLLQTINDLWTWRTNMYERSDKLCKTLVKKHNLALLGRSPSATTHQALQRDTTYSPPEPTMPWHKPASLYGYVPVNLTDRLLAAYNSSVLAPSRNTTSKYTPQGDEQYDANGWARVGDKWYNCIVDELWDESPYANEE